MNLTVITPPPFEPVSMADVYRQLRLTPDHVGSPSEQSHPDDLLLAGHITAAREYVEMATRRALVQQTIRLSAETFPRACYHRSWPFLIRGNVDRIVLRRPPVIRLQSVSYFDGENVATEVDPASCYLTDDQLPELRFTSDFSMPDLYERPDALRIEYVAGYPPAGSPPETQEEFAATIPQTLKNAVLIGVQLLYDNLAPSDRDAMERMREAMLQTYRIQHQP